MPPHQKNIARNLHFDFPKLERNWVNFWVLAFKGTGDNLKSGIPDNLSSFSLATHSLQKER